MTFHVVPTVAQLLGRGVFGLFEDTAGGEGLLSVFVSPDVFTKSHLHGPVGKEQINGKNKTKLLHLFFFFKNQDMTYSW